jgi:hypothetical protein
MEENERQEGFTVKDRRRFSAVGEAKEELAQERRSDGPETAEADGGSSEPLETRQGRDEADGTKEQPPPVPMDFSTLVLSLANSALFQLGLVKLPGAGEPKKDLSGAKQTIDILGLLEEKTRGNLTEPEKKILAETLFQLRMAFVEVSK